MLMEDDQQSKSPDVDCLGRGMLTEGDDCPCAFQEGDDDAGRGTLTEEDDCQCAFAEGDNYAG